jgi:hypothetical protein
MEVERRDGYGAFKRKQRCRVCYDTTGRVGVWKVTNDDGTIEYFCDEHVPTPSAP